MSDEVFFLLISTAMPEGSASLIDLSLQLSWVPTGNRSNCIAIELEFSGYVYQLLSSLVSPLGNFH